VNEQTDSQLLKAYVESRSEPVFAELVRRYTDLVYSAALRMVCDPHLAQDVTQNTFVALAKRAAQIKDRPALCGWLHQTARNIAAQTVRTDVRRRAREEEAVTMNEPLANDSNPEIAWEEIAPHLDAALEELGEADRDALMLRYFQNKPFHAIGFVLGVSDDAAQKRVTRAVERLREFFAKRGVAVSAGGLAVAVSANAVTAAPAGLAASISAVSLAPTAVSTTVVAASKVIATTTFQKILVAATVAVLAGAGVYETRRAAQLRDQVRTLQQQQASQSEQLQNMQRERDGASRQLAAMRDDNNRLNRDPAQLTRLDSRSGSKMRLEGTSTIHDWQVESPLILGYLDVGPNFPLEPGQYVTPGKVEAKGEASIVVRSLRSVKDNGMPYDEKMDDKMYHMMSYTNYPKIIYHLKELTLKEPPRDKDSAYIFDSNGDLAIAGVTNPISMVVTVLPLPGGRIKISGTIGLKMTDFKIEPANIILAKTGDDVKLKFDWVLGQRKPAAAANR
jgi:RNA polymerase sigma factor (sigma-70 family)